MSSLDPRVRARIVRRAVALVSILTLALAGVAGYFQARSEFSVTLSRSGRAAPAADTR